MVTQGVSSSREVVVAAGSLLCLNACLAMHGRSARPAPVSGSMGVAVGFGYLSWRVRCEVRGVIRRVRHLLQLLPKHPEPTCKQRRQRPLHQIPDYHYYIIIIFEVRSDVLILSSITTIYHQLKERSRTAFLNSLPLPPPPSFLNFSSHTPLVRSLKSLSLQNERV